MKKRNYMGQVFMPLMLVFMLVFPYLCFGEKTSFFRIGTGGRTGVYYPIGKLIAHGLTGAVEKKAMPETGSHGVPGYVGVAQNSAGSIENAKSVAAGKIEAGLVQADVAAWAYRAEHVFNGNKKVSVLRAVASLYPEKLQIVTRKDAGVQSFAKLRGKRISIDEIGSGTLSVMRIVLKAHGMTEKDLRPVYLKPVFTQDKMVSGELQGFVMMAGHPMEAVTQLAGTGITIVPIALKVALQISKQFPYLVPGEIPAGVYAGVPATPTLQVHALLVVSSVLDEDLVYQVTAALWSEAMQTLLRNGHPQGKSIVLQTALKGISIPLHPGAERFYRERGLLPETPKQ